MKTMSYLEKNKALLRLADTKHKTFWLRFGKILKHVLQEFSKLNGVISTGYSLI